MNISERSFREAPIFFSGLVVELSSEFYCIGTELFFSQCCVCAHALSILGACALFGDLPLAS